MERQTKVEGTDRQEPKPEDQREQLQELTKEELKGIIGGHGEIPYLKSRPM